MNYVKSAKTGLKIHVLDDWIPLEKGHFYREKKKSSQSFGFRQAHIKVQQHEALEAACFSMIVEQPC